MKEQYNKFAFISHFLNPKDLFFYYPFSKIFSPILNRFPKHFLKDIIKENFKYSSFYVRGFSSSSAKDVAGWIISCALFPEDFGYSNKKTLELLIKAGKYAQDLGAEILGLGGFTSILGNGGQVLADELGIAVTSGNTYTASLVIEGLTESMRILGLNTKGRKLTIIGATGDIGSICTKILSKDFKKVTLVARDEKKLIELARLIKDNTDVYYTTKIPEAIKEADVILTATSSITTIIDPKDLKRGVILCDVAFPPNIARNIMNLRDDIFVFEGGKCLLPAPKTIKDRRWNSIFPEGIIFGCLAETIILCLENKFDDFSIGRGCITEKKINLISNLAKKHGFQLAPFKCGNSYYTENQIAKIREMIK